MYDKLKKNYNSSLMSSLRMALCKLPCEIVQHLDKKKREKIREQSDEWIQICLAETCFFIYTVFLELAPTHAASTVRWCSCFDASLLAT